MITPPLWFALIAALLFAGVAFALKLLSKSGAVATALLGFVVFGLGGGYFMVPMLVFFFTSSLLSKVGKDRKATANAGDAKGSTRDAAQVFANGGVAGIVVLWFALTVKVAPPIQSRALLLLYLAALAAANADTWATEIGKFSKTLPRSLRDWKPVPAGTSGAITPLGTFGAVLGAIVIPLSAIPFWHLNPAEFLAPVWCGLLACGVDSLLGATVQAQYRNPVTQELTEKNEVNGQGTQLVRGFRRLDNDVVNFLACAVGALFCWILAKYGISPYQ